MNNPDFLLNITTDDWVLTPNRRLATFLRQYYDEYQLAQGRDAWSNLQIYPVSNWTEIYWDKTVHDSRLVLTDVQEILTWEQVIRDCTTDEILLNYTTTAKAVKDTWQLINHWLLPIEKLSQDNLIEVQHFMCFVNHFIQRCDEKHYISRAELLPGLIHNIKALTPFLPTHIYFIGFEDFSPALQTLRDNLKQHCEIKDLSIYQVKKATTALAPFPDDETELREMARWAYRSHMEKPNAVIGCIIPNLTEKREQVLRIFTEVYFAEAIEIETLPFNISASRHLSDYPILKSAIQILDFQLGACLHNEFSELLLSPFIGEAISEINERALFNTWLQSNCEMYIDVNRLIDSSPLQKICPKFHARLIQIKNFKQSVVNTKLENLINDFIKQLQIMGWPGEASLNSIEYQVVERFRKSFDELITFEKFFSKITIKQGIGLLIKLLQNTLFQAKTNENAPIQILGLLEASGLLFDKLWVSQLNHETWPAPIKPNPFIPVAIQKKYQMPHATCERELQYSISLTQGFIRSAKEVIFSYALMDGERQLMPSSLVSHHPLMTFDPTSYLSLEKKIFRTKELETYFDETGPPVEGTLSKGGSALFKAQAACPFRAFAKYRLNATSMENIQFGLSPADRGKIIHHVLAAIWNEIKSHQQLCQFSPEELTNFIFNKVQISLISYQNKKPYTLRPTTISLESTRIVNLVVEWLNLEKNRMPFSVIKCETKEMVKIGKITVELQLDRVDQLPDETHILIDYKTGKVHFLDWFGERPNEPQLPLYSMSDSHNLSGIFFAQVRRGDLNFQGISENNNNISHAISLVDLEKYDLMFSSFAEMSAYWYEKLNNLSEAFCQGVATIDPKETTTCQFCDLQTFCRV